MFPGSPVGRLSLLCVNVWEVHAGHLQALGSLRMRLSCQPHGLNSRKEESSSETCLLLSLALTWD